MKYLHVTSLNILKIQNRVNIAVSCTKISRFRTTVEFPTPLSIHSYTFLLIYYSSSSPDEILTHSYTHILQYIGRNWRVLHRLRSGHRHTQKVYFDTLNRASTRDFQRDSRKDTLFIEVKSESLGRESLIVLHKKEHLWVSISFSVPDHST